MEFFLVVDTSADNQETYLPFDRELVEECKQQVSYLFFNS